MLWVSDLRGLATGYGVCDCRDGTFSWDHDLFTLAEVTQCDAVVCQFIFADDERKTASGSVGILHLRFQAASAEGDACANPGIAQVGHKFHRNELGGIIQVRDEYLRFLPR